MSYTTYTTQALVCGSRDSYTADRSYSLFTRRGGMLYASARSVRLERSKQRCALQDFSLIEVSLVSGKTGWRIGSARSLNNYYYKAQSRKARTEIATAIRMLKRYLRGETAEEIIFEDTILFLEAVTESEEEHTNVELADVYKLRLLYHLGYIAPHETYQDILTTKDWLSLGATKRSIAQDAIKRAEEASHL